MSTTPSLFRDTSRPSMEMAARIAEINMADPSRPKRWIPIRLILQNYWYIDYQEFHFVTGRLVLNGRNGSGKTSVGAVAVPVALDMNKGRKRFDPFGGKEKNPAYYLLGLPDAKSTSAFYHEDRTGYIVWEFQHGETGEFVTHGIALRARRADGPEPPIQSWGFAVRGQRVGVEFDLTIRDGRGRDVPVTKEELKRKLGRAHVHETNRDYQAAVNELLYGFETVEQYLHLTDTLLSLRAPKLDRGLSPDKLSASMREALPSLSQELMGRLSQLIKRIDAASEALAESEDHVRRATEIHEAQGAFANQLAQQIAVRVLEVAAEHDRKRRQYEDKEAKRLAEQQELDRVNASIDVIEAELRDAEGAYDIQRNSEAYKSLESLQATQREHAESQRGEARAHREVALAADRVNEAAASLKRVEGEWFTDVAEIESRCDEAMETTRAARWPEAEVRLRAATVALTKAAVGLEPTADTDAIAALDSVAISAAGKERGEHCKRVITAIEARATAQRRFDETQHKVALASDVRRAADEHVRTTTTALEQTRNDAAAAVEQWVADAPFRAPEHALQAAIAEIETFVGPGTPAAVTAPLLEAAREAVKLHGAAQRGIVAEIVALEHTNKELERELAMWRDKAWDPPSERPGQVAARTALAAGGIPAVPLYAACDFRDGVSVDEQIRIEAAIEEAGLLDALIVPASAREMVRDLLREGALGADAGDRWVVIADSLPAGQSLAACLMPATDALSAADVEAALRSIAYHVDVTAPLAGGAVVRSDGSWAQGLLEGRTSPRAEAAPRFIGENNRKRRRAAEIRRLEQALSELATRLTALVASRDAEVSAQREIEASIDSLGRLPGLLALQNAAADLSSARREFERATQRVAQAEAELESARAAAKQASAAYDAAVVAFEPARGLARDQVIELGTTTRRVIDTVRNIEYSISQLDRLRDRATRARRAITAAEEQRSEREFEVQEARARGHEVEGRLRTIRELLAGKGADQIQQEVTRLKQRIEELRDEGGKKRERRGTITSTISRLKEDVERLRDELVRAEGRAREVEKEFEFALERYAEPAMQRALAKLQSASDGAIPAAEELLKHRRADRADLERLRSAVSDRMTRVMGQLHRAFQNHRTDLARYRPELTDNWASFVGVGDGQRVAADVFLDRLRAIVEDQKTAVSVAENELYVNFFLGDVINAVRRKVLEAQDFAKLIDQILQKMQISNGAKFSLTWTVRKAVGATGIDYEKLVAFVQTDPDAVTAEKRDSMLAEFRARVDFVRDEAKRRGESAYGEQLQQEFDYRSWFEFRFFFEKPNEPRVELKERGIEQLSGGERTLAQVLPLVAAVHAHSLATKRQDAPKLIAMDEAFAGVDHQNMNEVLKILVDLEFSWVLSSERLWGDSKHVPGCATYTMRAEDGVVFPMLFVWDGRRRLAEADMAGRTGHAGVNRNGTGNGTDDENGAGAHAASPLPPTRAR